MLQLSSIGVAEALHEVWRCIVPGAGAVQQEQRCILVSPDDDGTLRAEHLCPNIIPIESVAAHFDIAERATHKAQVDHGIVDITDGLKNFAHKNGSLRGHTLNFAAHQPASKVEIVDAHV